MLDERGWSASRIDAISYGLLIWAAEDENVGRSLEDASPELGTDAPELYNILREFWGAGLATDNERASVESANCVMLTPAGTELAREMTTARQNRSKRRAALRNAIIDWLGNLPAENQPRGLGDFLYDDSSRASFFGDAYSVGELVEAGNYLKENGLITGLHQVLRPMSTPELTSAGLDCFDGHSADVSAFLNRSRGLTGHTNVTINNSTGVAVAANSNNVNQSVGISQKTVNDIQKLVESFQQTRAMLELDAEHEAQLVQVTRDLTEEISRPVPDTNKLKGFLQTLHSIGVNAAGGVLGSVLGEHALTVMNSF